MPDSMPLFSCRYIPLFWTILFGCIVIVLCLVKSSQAEFLDLFSIQDWQRVLLDQPLYGWLMAAFLLIFVIFLANTKLIVTRDVIFVKGFSLVFTTFAERQKVGKLQLYNHSNSESWVLKPLFRRGGLSIEEQWRTSTIGIIMKPTYRFSHPVQRIWLGQFPYADRIQIIQVLQRY
ncbi:hypothetical protein [Acinetobacter thermotolerans]|uniref:hypothetical protein n=1 Tax=Acinetobacter thermotolerans TaxID=3151487 RepID=UPI00325C1CCA